MTVPTQQTPVSETLSQAIMQQTIASDDVTSLLKLEQYILHGISSFGGRSIVIQGRGINATMARYRDLYIAMVKELQGDEVAYQTLAKGVLGFPKIN